MIASVADTHTAVWYLYNDPRLSLTAKMLIETTAATGHQVGVSSISVAEMVYLVEKGRIDSQALAVLTRALRSPEHVFAEVALSAEIAQNMAAIPREQVPDLPDRIIAATALQQGVPVISRDRRIRASVLQTVW